MDRSRLIIIPAYNEEKTIGEIVCKAKVYGTVLVVDDFSSDKTVEIARASGAEVLVPSSNGGYENTLNRGFTYALEKGYQNVVTIDADGEHEPSLLNDFFHVLETTHCHLVLGIRPRKQRLAEVVMGYYFNFIFGAKDILCGMKGYSIVALRNSELPGGAGIGTAAAVHALRKGEAFQQIDVWGKPRVDSPRFGNRIRGNIKIFKVFFNIIFNTTSAGK
ncbi:glycosyltransferase family 2 protein [Pusillimonas sp. CC-YST705]|uniref:Glycosyltransferase family 2 protein n=1 Tax=Mesopusillimonas faecipullorum TaxID=2755040 RepID=A0ABS8CB05_9BURK|nr:glycosyltransferase family 2 protein [Mesopusillimonas faecipullorum]MCB5363034.1 glycosyltransferase family 2 protein [Mesopusillimonas faecipullorum]